jgi:hypothetical protein
MTAIRRHDAADKAEESIELDNANATLCEDQTRESAELLPKPSAIVRSSTEPRDQNEQREQSGCDEANCSHDDAYGDSAYYAAQGLARGGAASFAPIAGAVHEGSSFSNKKHPKYLLIAKFGIV